MGQVRTYHACGRSLAPGCGWGLVPAGRKAPPPHLQACSRQQALLLPEAQQSDADLTGRTLVLPDGNQFGRWGLLSGGRRGKHR